MQNLIKIEEAAQFLLSIYLFAKLPIAWWWFPALLLVPDISMIGYLFNTHAGAWLYNFFHHKAVAIAVLLLGYVSNNNYIILTGIILFGHSSMDRMLGYGLKFEDSFHHTHLGLIGKR
jgi:hypothetical protein